MADLIIRGGTVVTATGRSTADVAITGGRITAVGAVAARAMLTRARSTPPVCSCCPA